MYYIMIILFIIFCILPFSRHRWILNSTLKGKKLKLNVNEKIETDAEKYVISTFKWPKNKLGEDQAIPTGQKVPNGYTKHIKLTKKPFIDGVLSETAKNYWYESFRNENK